MTKFPKLGLQDRLVIKVVPMLNPDGVFLGNYRCSSLGQDLNRCYQSPKQWNHPEIYVSLSYAPHAVRFLFWNCRLPSSSVRIWRSFRSLSRAPIWRCGSSR